MNFDDVIKQQREKQNQIATASVEFMTVRELFQALIARYPDQSLETFSQQLFKIFQSRNSRPSFYHRDDENAAWGELHTLPLQGRHVSKMESYGELLVMMNGRYHSISEMLGSVRKAPFDELGLELYGLHRADVTELLGLDIETESAPAVSDYVTSLEQENAALRAEIQRIKESYQPPALNGESYAACREQVLIAILALLHDLDRKGELKPKNKGLCIPNAATLEALLNRHQALFWPDAGRPPISDAKIKEILREAARLLKDGENPDLEQRSKSRQKNNRNLKK